MPHRILVVDDEEPIRALLKTHFEGVGYRVVGVADGVEGIRAFEQKKPHLVIIDFLLPRKNGFAVAEAIRKDPERGKVPLIMMSGVFKNPKTAVEARDKYQVLDFLSKPLDLNQLTTLVAKGLANVAPEPDEPEPPPPPPPPPEPDPVEVAVARAAAPSVPRGRLEPVAMVREAAPEQGTAAARPPPRGLSYFASGKPKPAPRPASVVPDGNIRDGVFQARPFPVLAEEGDIEVLPVALLLSTIRYDQATGMLDMSDPGGTHRRIYIVNGNPTFMQSNAEGENVGALLLRRGRITEPDFERCLRYMKDKGRTLQQSVLELRLVSESDLATAYKLLAGQLLPLALGMSAGTYRWRETDAFVGRVPEGKFEPVTTLFEGIKRHVHPPTILKFFKGREDVPLMRTLEFERLMPFFRRSFSANNVAAEVDGASTYRTLTRAHNADAAQVVPQLCALVTSGMAVLPELDEENAMAVAVNVAAAEVAGMAALDEMSGIELSFEDETGDAAQRDDKKAQEIIARYYDVIRSQNFFEIFGVKPAADEDEVKARYFELAKKWHIDAFTGQNLGATRAKLEAIFQRITEAYETITDRVRREEYLTYLDRRARGLPTDVNEVRRTELLFDQALAMIRRSDFVGARPVLEEAVRKNPDPNYFAALGWVIYNLDPSAQQNVTEAVKLLRKAIHEQENLAAAYQYLGQIAYRRNALPEAKKWWERCLEWEPNNPEATRGLRSLAQRGDVPIPSSSQPGQRGPANKISNKK
jgi:CheY-like chemotaxis protein